MPIQNHTAVSTREILINARAIIARAWSPYSIAEDAYGKKCDALSESAVAWSIGGAIRLAGKLADDSDTARAAAAIRTVNIVVNDLTPSTWEQIGGRTLSEVLQLFDIVIEAQRHRKRLERITAWVDYCDTISLAIPQVVRGFRQAYAPLFRVA